LRELAWLFLKLGTIAFGGPAAHIAMMEDEVVRRRGWLTHAEFLDLLGAANLIPGPNSTELAIHVGHRQAGVRGLIVAGVCFIVPAMVMVIACGWAYRRFGKLPEVSAILYGVKPVIIAIVFRALWNLSKSAIKTKFLAVVAVVCVAASAAGANQIAILFGAGLIVCVTRIAKIRMAGGKFGFQLLPGFQPLITPVSAASASVAVSGAAATPFGIWPLFLFFLKVGSVLYGSGYVLLAFLRSGLVEHFGWLTESQLLDAIAVGQITPGPVFTTATFVGYILGGPPAALAATAGIFLPAFFFVAISGPLIPRIRGSPSAGAFLDGVNAASLALMALVTFQLSRAALMDWLTAGLALGAALVQLRWKLNSAWLVAAGALAGVLAEIARNNWVFPK
jgi:chromate transporter